MPELAPGVEGGADIGVVVVVAVAVAVVVVVTGNAVEVVSTEGV